MLETNKDVEKNHADVLLNIETGTKTKIEDLEE